MNLPRHGYLDSLRGLAALMVVMVHFLAAFFPYSIFGTQGHYQQHSAIESIFFYPPFGLFVAGHFAVCLFFILSGYVLSYKYLGESNQGYDLIGAIVKRPIRLGGLVWASIIVGFVFWEIGFFYNYSVSKITTSIPWFSNFWFGSIEVPQFFADLTMSPFFRGNLYNPPLWTIKIELYGSVMVYLFLLVFGNKRYRILIAIFFLLLFKDSLFQGFWLGLIMADLRKHYNFSCLGRAKSFLFKIAIGVFVYLSSFPNYVGHQFLVNTPYSFLPDDQNFGGGYPMLAALLLFVLVLSNEQLQEGLTKPVFLFFGKVSYGLYVIHLLVIGSLSSWLFLLFHDVFGYCFSFIIAFVFGLTVIIFLSWLVTEYIDIPFIKLSKFVGNKTVLAIKYIKKK